jgi:hypothetical protein
VWKNDIPEMYIQTFRGKHGCRSPRVLSSIYGNHLISYISLSFSDEAHSDKAKESIRAKCIQYLDRAEKLKEYVHGKQNKKKQVKDGGNSGSKDKYVKYINILGF